MQFYLSSSRLLLYRVLSPNILGRTVQVVCAVPGFKTLSYAVGINRYDAFPDNQEQASTMPLLGLMAGWRWRMSKACLKAIAPSHTSGFEHPAARDHLWRLFL